MGFNALGNSGSAFRSVVLLSGDLWNEPVSVPDPASTLVLLGMTLAGLAGFGRASQQRQP